jgi:hypothetical protein
MICPALHKIPSLPALIPELFYCLETSSEVVIQHTLFSILCKYFLRSRIQFHALVVSCIETLQWIISGVCTSKFTWCTSFSEIIKLHKSCFMKHANSRTICSQILLLSVQDYITHSIYLADIKMPCTWEREWMAQNSLELFLFKN